MLAAHQPQDVGRYPGQDLGTYRRNKQWETLDDQDTNSEEQSNRRKNVLHLPKDHPHFTQIIMHLSCLHRCQSEKMR